MSRIETLKSEFYTLQKELERAADAYPWEDRAAYLAWISSTYEYAFNSTRILAHAAARFPANHTVFSNRFIAHAAEEKGHERLLENDMKNLKANFSDFPASTTAKSFHYSLYYYLTKGNPLGIFGWVMVLECFAVKNVPRIFERCKAAHGPKCVSFLKVHAEEDEDHFAKALTTLDSLSEEDCDVVLEAVRFYSRSYAKLYDVKMVLSETRANNLAA